jgi:hypothetical protein
VGVEIPVVAGVMDSTYKEIIKTDMEKLAETVSQLSWNDLYSARGTEEKFLILAGKTTHSINTCTLKKRVKLHDKMKFWVNKELRESSKIKRYLYSRMKSLQSDATKKAYFDHMRAHERLRKNTKRNYYVMKLNKCRNDPSKIWSLVKETCGKQQQKGKIHSEQSGRQACRRW